MRINDHEANRLRLLKAIRRAEPVARTELVALTGLAPATISELTADLVRRGTLLEEKAPVLTTGRPRMKLRLNPEAAHVVGALLLPTGVLEIVIVNLRGDLLFSESPRLSYTTTLENIAIQIADAIEAAIATSPFSKTEIDRVGIGLPGVIDSAEGMLHWLQTYPAGPFPMAGLIGARLGLPTCIDNNANIVARAEHWFGDSAHVDDFCLLMVGLGLGFAQYTEGSLWGSVGGLNPEFGHIKVMFEGGRQCVCGASGCLSAYCTTFSITADICERRGIETPHFLDVDDRFEQFLAEARASDPIASAAFARAGHVLGIAMANYVNFWDPGRIIILCMRDGLAELLSPAFDAALERNIFPALLGRTTVEVRLANEEQFTKGSAALVLEQLYRVSRDQPGRRRPEPQRSEP